MNNHTNPPPASHMFNDWGVNRPHTSDVMTLSRVSLVPPPTPVAPNHFHTNPDLVRRAEDLIMSIEHKINVLELEKRNPILNDTKKKDETAATKLPPVQNGVMTTSNTEKQSA
uniref:Uncharacterized protein n=1 Tax=Psilocybe cubensis TaxID=181762 RepID=A0A8H7XV61_PSICU